MRPNMICRFVFRVFERRVASRMCFQSLCKHEDADRCLRMSFAKAKLVAHIRFLYGEKLLFLRVRFQNHSRFLSSRQKALLWASAENC